VVRSISDETTRPTYMLAKSERGTFGGFRVYLHDSKLRRFDKMD
jgi:hypothetical protein